MKNQVINQTFFSGQKYQKGVQFMAFFCLLLSHGEENGVEPFEISNNKNYSERKCIKDQSI